MQKLPYQKSTTKMGNRTIHNQVLCLISLCLPVLAQTNLQVTAFNADSVNIGKATPVAILPSNGGFIRANSSLTNYPFGVLAQDAAVGYPCPVIIDGEISLTDWTTIAGSATLAAGSLYYISSTPGKITTTQSGTAQIIGVALSQTALLVSVQSGSTGGGGGISQTNISAAAVTNAGNLIWSNATSVDLAGTAQKATNGLGSAAFTSSSAYDASGTALGATNGLLSAAFVSSNTLWANSSNLVQQATNGLLSAAFVSSNTLWLNSSNLTQQATNGLLSAAFVSSNTLWVNSSNLVYQGTNGLASGAFVSSNTAWVNSSNLVYQGTNGLASGAFVSSNTAWVNSSNLTQQATNGLASGAFVSSNTAWVNSSNLVQQATNALAVANTNLWDAKGAAQTATNQLAIANTNLWLGINANAASATTATTATTATYTTGNSSALTNSFNSTNNWTHYGLVDTNDTTHSFELLTNGSLYISNAVTGAWQQRTNDSITASNLQGGYLTYTNLGLTITNRTAANTGSTLTSSNLVITTGSNGSNTLYAANGTTVITVMTNGGAWLANPISVPGVTNSGLLSADAISSDANGNQVAATTISMAHIVQPGVIVTNGETQTITISNNFRIDQAHYILGNLSQATNTITSQSANYNIATTDQFILLSGAHTATLPTAAGVAGKEYTIICSSSGTNAILTTSSQTIDGGTKWTNTAIYKAVTVVSDGANWWVVNQN